VTSDEVGRLLGPADVRRLAHEFGIRPTKRLGQNFVVDANTVRRIVRTAGVGAGDVVVEVGPGLGSLTLGLLATGAHVVAVEIDPALAHALPTTVTTQMPAARSRLEIVTADALTLTSLPGGAPSALVANLPYNVAVPVLLHALETWPSIATGLVMVQAEVANRIAAPPGSRTYGVPSVKVGWWATASRAGAIPRAVFWPVPNVDSALVRLVRRPESARTVGRAELYAVVDAAFAQRRKSLRGALSSWAGSAAAAETALREAGIDPAARGESLGVAEFERLAVAGRALRSAS
jgi:16S rRNA (adenine1518-N6/adenine1519-N6)-dimethyltransferase